jgi:hypothetical protein
MKDNQNSEGKRDLSNCVIIGDIKKSRDLDNWEHVFGTLKSALQETNKRFSDIIVVTFAPTIGDEFQGAIITPEKAFEVCNFIKSRLQIEIYYAIGVGNIEKPVAKEMGMRGSAFYRAREALEICKKEERKIIIRSSSRPNAADDMINELFHFIELLENSWTERQRALVNYYRLHPNYTYEQLGKHFGYTRQAAHQSLIGAHWGLLMAGNNLVDELLRSDLKK